MNPSKTSGDTHVFRRRPLAVAVAGGLALSLGVPGLAAAQVEGDPAEPTVNTTVEGSGRQLQVLDLDGTDLTELHLRNGVGRPFEVRVTDTNQPSGRPLDVQTTLNNLYLDEGTDDQFIATEHVTMSFAGDVARLSETDLDLVALVNLQENPAADCGGLIDSLTDRLLRISLCNAVDHVLGLLGDSGLDLDLPPLELSTEEVLGNLIGDLPKPGSPGTYHDPDCVNGLGGGRCGTAAEDATRRFPLTGRTLGVDDIDLDGLIAELESLPLAGLGGDGALASLEDVLGAFELVGDPDLHAALGDLRAELQQLSDARQVDVLNDTFELGSLIPTDLRNISGQYRSFPSLRVDTPMDTPGGDYRGTLVVTMVD